MTTSSHWQSRARWLLLAMTLPSMPWDAGASPLRVGGSVGFEVLTRRTPGNFRWDFDAASMDSALAVVSLGAQTGALQGFVSLAARRGDTASPFLPRFTLREASLLVAWRRDVADSLALRLFARQPQSLWMEHALVLPVVPWDPGNADVLGGRVDGHRGALTATFLVASRGQALDRTPESPAPQPEPPQDDFFIVRARGDALQWGGLRLGGSWKGVHLDPRFHTNDPSRSDILEVDARAAWSGVLGAVEYAQSTGSTQSVEFGSGTSGTSNSGAQNGGPVTAGLSAEAALHAELRASALPLRAWGRLGLVASYRALGRDYFDPLAAAEPDLGNPRRGIEGYRIEAWFQAQTWPAQLRQTYDRSQQFRDADRRVIAQRTEAVVWLTESIRSRVWYTQRDERLDAAGIHVHRDELIGEWVVEDRAARLRLQGGALGLHSSLQRSVGAFEVAAPLGSHLQAVTRATFVTAPAAVHRSLFVELQYWHLPQFELMLSYGPDWIGDAADPVRDGDLIADRDAADRVGLHFRGWF